MPLGQKSCCSSPIIGKAPQESETASTPGTAASRASSSRVAARIAAGRRGRLGGRERQLEAQRVARDEAGVDAPEARDGAEHEAGADEEDERGRHLDDDEDALGAAARPHATAAPQRVVEVGAAREEHRHEAEEEPGGERDRHRHGEDAPVDADGGGARKIERQEREDGARAPGGDEEPEPAAEEREEKALGEELPEEPLAPGAEGDADRELAGPAARAREEEVGHVGAGDEEDERDRAEEDEEERPHVSDHRVGERHQARAGALVGVGIGEGETARDAVEVGLRLRDRHAGSQPPDAVDAEAGAAVLQERVLPLPDRHVDVAALEVPHDEVEARRQDADDGEVLAVEEEAAADDVGIAAELALPEAGADQDHRRRARPVLVGGEVAPEHRLDAEHAEEVRRDELALEALRLADAGQAEALHARHRHRGEAAVLPLPVAEVEERDRAAPEVRLALVDRDQLLGARVRERLEEDAAHHREEGGVGADAEREGHDRDGGEAGAAPEDAQAVAQVLEQRLDEADAARVAVLLLDRLDAAELEAGAPHRLVFAQAGAAVLVRLHLEVEAELLVELVLDGAAAEERAQAVAEVAQHRYTSRRTRAMASVSFFHSSVSVSSCFFPARVSS